MVKDAENTVWIGLEYTCEEGDKYWNMSEKEFINMIFLHLSYNVLTYGKNFCKKGMKAPKSKGDMSIQLNLGIYKYKLCLWAYK